MCSGPELGAPVVVTPASRAGVRGPGPQATEAQQKGLPGTQPWALYLPPGLSELYLKPQKTETLGLQMWK